MVGKLQRKRESSELEHCSVDDQTAMDECDILGDMDHKRLRLDTDMSGDDDLPGYTMLSPSDFADTDLMHDSGSDCVPMESPLDTEDPGDEEPYIDVVSEDSAIQEEEPIDDYTGCGTEEPVHYSHMSHMDNLISSHDDSAIIKSEIFESAYDHDMNQVLSSAGGDYEHAFLDYVESSHILNGMPMGNGVVDPLCDSLSEKSSLESLSPNSAHSLSGGSSCDVGSTAFDISSKPSSPVNLDPNANFAMTLGNEAGSTAAAPNMNSASLTLNSVTSPVLTTPVFFAQGVPGPAGQTNSIITTHMARLVPSPDGKGYILHLGLNPGTNPIASAAASNSTNASFSNTTASVPPQLSSQVAMGTQLATGGTAQLTGTVSMNGLNPASLNITITPATTQPSVIGGADVPTPIPADMSASSSSPLGGSTLETDQEGNIMLINNTNNGRTGSEVMNVGDPVGTRVDSASYLNVINQQPGANINNINTTGSAIASPGNDFESLMTSLSNSVSVSESLLSAQPSLISDALNTKHLLNNATPSEQQLLRLMQPQTQPQVPSTTAATTTTKSKSSKRRNSRELRELVELEKISSSKSGDDLDRFVICSDGPMNCALCGYNTGSYSSFKSHIICSHPCWRITKKLSRNRLLVEKSVKVSIPVANFSVPNPVPAVPIQPRVQSKKGKKEKASDKDNNTVSGSTNGKEQSEKHHAKHSKHKSDKNGSNSTSSKNSTNSRSASSSQSRTNSHHSKSNYRSSSMKSSTESASGSLRSVKRSLSDGDLSDVMDASSTDALSGLTGRERQIIERNKRIFRCTKCMRLFVFEGSVVNHIMDQHGIKKAYDHLEVSNDHGNTFGPMFRCPHGNCCYTSSSVQELDRHKAEKHTLQKVYRCQICGYSADSTKAVKEHAAKIHPQKGMMYGLTD